jgi:hypothetical protein
MLAPAARIRSIDMDIKLVHERHLDVLGVYPSPVIWGDHLPSAIASTRTPGSAALQHRPPVQTPLQPKGAASIALPALQGHLYAARKLGLRGYVKCHLADLRFAWERRRSRRPRGAIPIIKAIAPRQR